MSDISLLKYFNFFIIIIRRLSEKLHLCHIIAPPRFIIKMELSTRYPSVWSYLYLGHTCPKIKQKYGKNQYSMMFWLCSPLICFMVSSFYVRRSSKWFEEFTLLFSAIININGLPEYFYCQNTRNNYSIIICYIITAAELEGAESFEFL